MAKSYKCIKCGRSVSGENAISVNSKKYCPICGKSRLTEIKFATKLNDFLYNLCGCDSEMMPFLNQQVNYMVDHNGYKESGILATLEYIYSKLDNPPPFNPSAGIRYMVTKYYVEARDYYLKIKELNAYPDEEIEKAFNVPTQIIVLKRSALEEQSQQERERLKNKVYGEEIDLDSIPDEEEITPLQYNPQYSAINELDFKWEG